MKHAPITADTLAGLALQIEHRPIASLIPYARNARTHSEAQVALIAGSIREFGFVNPVLVDGSNGIIAGQQSPWLGIANKQLELMGRFMVELGMTPAARSRVTTDAPTGHDPIQFVTIYEEDSATAATDMLLEKLDGIASRVAAAEPQERK